MQAGQARQILGSSPCQIRAALLKKQRRSKATRGCWNPAARDSHLSVIQGQTHLAARDLPELAARGSLIPVARGSVRLVAQARLSLPPCSVAPPRWAARHPLESAVAQPLRSLEGQCYSRLCAVHSSLVGLARSRRRLAKHSARLDATPVCAGRRRSSQSGGWR